jgi:hypothetical protein
VSAIIFNLYIGLQKLISLSLKSEMQLRAIIISLAMAASALPLASVNSSAVNVDFAKRVDRVLNSIGIAKRVFQNEPSVDIAKRGSETNASIDIAKRINESESSVDIAKRGSETDASIDIAKRTKHTNTSVDIA